MIWTTIRTFANLFKHLPVNSKVIKMRLASIKKQGESDETRRARLIAEKCAIQCYLNEQQFTCLFYTGSKITLLGLSMMKALFPTVKIQQIKNLSHENDLVLAAASGSSIPYIGYAEVILKITRFNKIIVPFLITEQDFKLLILG